MSEAIVPPVSQYRPLSQDVYEGLRDAIFTQRLAPGERIVEAEIARQMGISRSPIREALRRLEQDGLITYLPRRGAVVVASLSPDEVRDVYYVRAHLEAYAIRLAVSRATDDDLAALEALIDRMGECAAGGDGRGLIAADVDFHRRICWVSGSKSIYQLWNTLNPHSWTVLTSVKAWGLTPSVLAERHRAVLDALRSRDADFAEAVIRHHITELADNVAAHLDAQAEANGDGDPETSGRQDAPQTPS